MNILKSGSIILVVFVCSMMLSCITLKQSPQEQLPRSLWGEWTFVKSGTLTINGTHKLQDYKNVCGTEGDRINFSSDHKMSLRWFDRVCAMHQYLIGQYHLEGKILYVDLAKSRPYQDRLFPPITKFRIMQITATTLELEEIPHGSRRSRDRAKPGHEPLVFVFMKQD